MLERGENTILTDNNAIAHCGINLVHQLAGKYGAGFLSCIIYAGTAPCPMCMGAIFRSSIGRLVFALSNTGYHSVAGTANPASFFKWHLKHSLLTVAEK